jgi:hypothetical protein
MYLSDYSFIPIRAYWTFHAFACILSFSEILSGCPEVKSGTGITNYAVVDTSSRAMLRSEPQEIRQYPCNRQETTKPGS